MESFETDPKNQILAKFGQNDGLIWPILMPNLANFEKLKLRMHTYLKCLLESRFWVEKSKRAKRYALGSSLAQKVCKRATLSATKVGKWLFGSLLLVQKVCQASSWWLNGGQNGEGGAKQKIHPVSVLLHLKCFMSPA